MFILRLALEPAYAVIPPSLLNWVVGPGQYTHTHGPTISLKIIFYILIIAQ